LRQLRFRVDNSGSGSDSSSLRRDDGGAAIKGAGDTGRRRPDCEVGALERVLLAIISRQEGAAMGYNGLRRGYEGGTDDGGRKKEGNVANRKQTNTVYTVPCCAAPRPLPCSVAISCRRPRASVAGLVLLSRTSCFWGIGNKI
jgi:hypothetical protein